jgi:hypothetical protein
MGALTRISNAFHRRDDGRYFRTRNLHLATVLFAQNFTLVNVDRTDPANCEFVFNPALFPLLPEVFGDPSRQVAVVSAGEL